MLCYAGMGAWSDVTIRLSGDLPDGRLGGRRTLGGRRQLGWRRRFGLLSTILCHVGTVQGQCVQVLEKPGFMESRKDGKELVVDDTRRSLEWFRFHGRSYPGTLESIPYDRDQLRG